MMLRLSETQLRILRLVAEGLSNREIAAQLKITEGTTKWHLKEIYGNAVDATQYSGLVNLLLTF